MNSNIGDTKVAEMGYVAMYPESYLISASWNNNRHSRVHAVKKNIMKTLCGKKVTNYWFEKTTNSGVSCTPCNQALSESQNDYSNRRHLRSIL